MKRRKHAQTKGLIPTAYLSAHADSIMVDTTINDTARKTRNDKPHDAWDRSNILFFRTYTQKNMRVPAYRSTYAYVCMYVRTYAFTCTVLVGVLVDSFHPVSSPRLYFFVSPLKPPLHIYARTFSVSTVALLCSLLFIATVDDSAW